MTKTSIYCYERNGGGCRNRVSPANNFVCAAGHGDGSQTFSHIDAGMALPKMGLKQRKKLARDSSTLPRTLGLLAEDEDWHVREAVAWNSSTPPETLAQLIEDEDWNVRRGLAHNTSASPETLALLTKDRSVCYAIADNPSASPETHIFLAQQGHPPYGFTRGKSIDELTKSVHLIDQCPDTFGEAYLRRLLDDPLPKDKSHPKRRVLIGYAYKKYVEDGKVSAQKYKKKIKALFPDDQEMAEMVGY